MYVGARLICIILLLFSIDIYDNAVVACFLLTGFYTFGWFLFPVVEYDGSFPVVEYEGLFPVVEYDDSFPVVSVDTVRRV